MTQPPTDSARGVDVVALLDASDAMFLAVHGEETAREFRRARDTVAELIAERERLAQQLKDAHRDSFIKSRISYRGFSYGTESQWGIDSLRDAIKRNGDA